MELAGGALDAMRGSASASDRYLVHVHVDFETLIGRSDSPGYVEGGAALRGEELERFVEGSPMALFVKDTKGNPLFLGRSTKEMNRYFRRALSRRLPLLSVVRRSRAGGLACGGRGR